MRGKRKQVKRACQNCKLAHACCEDNRPCRRCINLGLADTCTDAITKKRGRKRTQRLNVPENHLELASPIPATLQQNTSFITESRRSTRIKNKRKIKEEEEGEVNNKSSGREQSVVKKEPGLVDTQQQMMVNHDTSSDTTQKFTMVTQQSINSLVVNEGGNNTKQNTIQNGLNTLNQSPSLSPSNNFNFFMNNSGTSQFHVDLLAEISRLRQLVQFQNHEIEMLKRENEKLKKQEKQEALSTFNSNAFSYAFENSTFAMCFVSIDGGDILSWNKSFQRILGYGDDALHTKIVSYKDIVDQSDWATSGILYWYCVSEKGKSFKAKVKCKHASGKIIEMSSHNDVLYDKESKRPIVCLSIVTDAVMLEDKPSESNTFLYSNAPNYLVK